MKKILLLLSLSLLLASSLTFAQDENDSDELNVVPQHLSRSLTPLKLSMRFGLPSITVLQESVMLPA